MSLLQHTAGLASPPPAAPPASTDLMRAHNDDSEKGNESADATATTTGLSGHEDARALVRLVQCRCCSRPYRSPVTLPCGNSLCRECLPSPHQREGLMSWPDLALRRNAITCPFDDCRQEHPVTDFGVDVIMSKVMESIADIVAKRSAVASAAHTSIEEVIRWDEVVAQTTEKPRIHEIPGGRLLATYMLAAMGQLHYTTELKYIDSEAEDEEGRSTDSSLLHDLVESTHREMDCQVCYSLMLEPVTTFCGHTLCRRCMARVLDHSYHCPVCRRRMSISPALSSQKPNKALTELLNGLCPESVAQRAEAVASEAFGGDDGELNTPLFVCTLAFPHQPTFLRIFEPRYRLMLRRCMDSNGQFGILMHNRYREPQGDLGPVHFYHYGTMLHIIHSQVLPDGTSLIETRGMYRFRVCAYGELDGYIVGNVERLDDVSLAEEERIEAEETSRTPTPPPEPPQDSSISDQAAATAGVSTDEDEQRQISRMTTHELLEVGRAFIVRMQQRSAPWLQQRVLSIHGQPPDDAAVFPYWFATVLPISEEEKYKLLGTRTVRERLKITAMWIRRIETQRW